MDAKPPTYDELLDLNRRQSRQIDELRAEGWGVLPISLQKILLDRKPAFARTVTESLLIYALGRGLQRDELFVVHGINDTNVTTSLTRTGPSPAAVNRTRTRSRRPRVSLTATIERPSGDRSGSASRCSRVSSRTLPLCRSKT